VNGTRIITDECDKTIKYYREDEEPTEDSYFVKDFKMEFDVRLEPLCFKLIII
jgi:hypothetical protein